MFRLDVALLVLLALASCAQVTASAEAEDGKILGIKVDEEGKQYISTDAGQKYLVYRDQETGKVFYFDTVTNEPQWDDPRVARKPKPPKPPLTVELNAGRKQRDPISTMLVALIPTMLFIGGAIARVWYLHTYYPELLYPTKTRKDRQRTSGGKFKAQKARGKMNQDGKGGRSANS